MPQLVSHARVLETYALRFGLMSCTACLAYNAWWFFCVERLRKLLPPGPEPEWPTFGLLRYFFPKRFDRGIYASAPELLWAESLHEQYGDTFTLWQPPRRPRVVTRNADAIEEALRQDGKTWHYPEDGVEALRDIYGSSVSILSGQEHARRRPLINEWWMKGKGEGGQSSFNQMLQAVHDIMDYGLFRKFEAASQGTKPILLGSVLYTFALSAILATVFGAQVTKEQLDRHPPEVLTQAHTILNQHIFGKFAAHANTCWSRPISRLLVWFDNLLGGWNAKVQHAWQVFAPFLDSLDVAEDGGLASWIHKHMYTSSEERMYWRGQAIDFVDAATDTVSKYLETSLMLIYSPSLKPTLSDLRSEINDCQSLSTGGYRRAQPTAESLTTETLPLLESVLKECMRLFPPASLTLLPRVMFEPGSARLCELLGMEPRAQAKVSLVLNIFGLHRHPAHWERPHEFLPERWNVIKTGVPSYRPFGGGIHSCPASKYLPIELRMVLADIISNFDLDLLTGSAAIRQDSSTCATSSSTRQPVADVESRFFYDFVFASPRIPLQAHVRRREHQSTDL